MSMASTSEKFICLTVSLNSFWNWVDNVGS